MDMRRIGWGPEPSEATPAWEMGYPRLHVLQRASTVLTHVIHYRVEPKTREPRRRQRTSHPETHFLSTTAGAAVAAAGRLKK